MCSVLSWNNYWFKTELWGNLWSRVHKNWHQRPVWWNSITDLILSCLYWVFFLSLSLVSWVGNSLKLLNGLKGQLVSHSWAQLPRPLNSYSDWLVWWGLASIAKSFSFFLVPQWRTTRFKKQFCSNAHIDCDVSVIYFFGMLYYAHLLSVFLKVFIRGWMSHSLQTKSTSGCK